MPNPKSTIEAIEDLRFAARVSCQPAQQRGDGSVSTGSGVRFAQTTSVSVASRIMALAKWRCPLLVWMFLGASTASAQPTGEVWGSLTVDWLATERLVCTLDVEP